MKQGFEHVISGLALVRSQYRAPSIIVCATDQIAEGLYHEMSFFSGARANEVFYLPDTETLPYDVDSPHSRVVSRRASVFHSMATTTMDATLIVSVATVMRRISPKSHWLESVRFLIGEKIDFSALSSKLVDMGYTPQELEIEDPGDFIVKKQVLDIFTSGSAIACRIKTDDVGVIQSIQSIDLSTQRSEVHLHQVVALPAKEMPVSASAIKRFRAEYPKHFERGYQDALFKSVVAGEHPQGIEYFLPLFAKPESLFDYIENEDSLNVVFLPGSIEKMGEAWKAIESRYSDLSSDDTRRALPPQELWVSLEEISNRLQSDSMNVIWDEDLSKTFPLKVEENGIERQKTVTDTIEMLSPAIRGQKKTLVCLFSQERVPQLDMLCQFLGMEPEPVTSWDEFLAADNRLCVCIANIDRGFVIPEEQTLVIAEKEIFGQVIMAKNEDLQEKGKSFEQIQDLQNLQVGDPIVHIEHGIGKFIQLKEMELNGRQQEFLVAEYADNATAYIKMDDLHMVSRYGGIAMEDTPLSTMGSLRWKENLKEATYKVREVAQQLIQLKHDRTGKTGERMNKPGSTYHKFIRDFPFQETKDQALAISETIQDLMSERLMDRTVVGDVGFGKTEVAMRAAFVVAESGFQTAVMVPTTLLAQQHYQSFKNRFEAHGKKVALLTRFDREEEYATLRGLENGEIDIVIGTHRVVQEDVLFKKLGLLIVDEEHRFGVSQKNQLSELRTSLNVLSLSATPIPRTLGMSLQGVRDLSVISTAPSKRLSIRTFVREKNEKVISEAIQRELMRQGQVFFLHNQVETLPETVAMIQSIVPEARIRYAHGQLPEDEITAIMRDFHMHKFDVLVCTTIIETGIDIPNANTILIDRADRFGLAQLHQLRGRVGRSYHQGYAYLMLDDADAISDSATKRLYAMEKATRLGDGFLIANHDLEIRGAGELLGEEQSGQIKNIGFALYMRLLDNAVKMMNEGITPTDEFDFGASLDVEIGLSGMMDRKYIPSERMRLSLYKRFSALSNQEELDQVKEEMEDRFGPVPATTESLMRLSKLRWCLRDSGIKKVFADDEVMIMEVRQSPKINMGRMIDMINEGMPAFKLLTPTKFSLHMEMPTIEGRESVIESIVSEIRA